MKKKQQPAVYNVAEENETYADDGTDLSLIRWMLSLSPTERLITLQNNVNAILKLRYAKSNR